VTALANLIAVVAAAGVLIGSLSYRYVEMCFRSLCLGGQERSGSFSDPPRMAMLVLLYVLLDVSWIELPRLLAISLQLIRLIVITLTVGTSFYAISVQWTNSGELNVIVLVFASASLVETVRQLWVTTASTTDDKNIFATSSWRVLYILLPALSCMIIVGVLAMHILARPNAATLALASDAHALGDATAAVTLVEFADFQCPACGQQEPILEKLVEDHPREIRFIYMHMPLSAIHPRAEIAAEASECAADQGRFWQFHHITFENQDDLSDDSLARYAERAGANMATFRHCLATQTVSPRIRSDIQRGRRLGVNSTPTIFVNGQRLEGAQTYEDLSRVIAKGLTATTHAQSQQ
jgi:protein-disulfide isomerase